MVEQNLKFQFQTLQLCNILHSTTTTTIIIVISIVLSLSLLHYPCYHFIKKQIIYNNLITTVNK